MTISFDFSELQNLAGDLGAAGEKAIGLARQVVAKAAHDVEAHAKSNAAVDTGAMRNSIGVDMFGNAVLSRATVGPTVNYAPFVENGTYRMPPQPFMGPAAATIEPAFLAAMGQIGDSIL